MKATNPVRAANLLEPGDVFKNKNRFYGTFKYKCLEAPKPSDRLNGIGVRVLILESSQTPEDINTEETVFFEPRAGAFKKLELLPF